MSKFIPASLRRPPSDAKSKLEEDRLRLHTLCVVLGVDWSQIDQLATRTNCRYIYDRLAAGDTIEEIARLVIR